MKTLKNNKAILLVLTTVLVAGVFLALIAAREEDPMKMRFAGEAQQELIFEKLFNELEGIKAEQEKLMDQQSALASKLENFTTTYDSLQKENEKLSKVVDSLKGMDGE